MTTATQLGLTTNQYTNLLGIVQAVKARGWSARAAVIAVSVAIAESGMQMYANGNNPQSLALPHDAVGWDHGSVGMFQQQVGGATNSTANWGTTRELMDPVISTGKFLQAMSGTNWSDTTVPLWVIAQEVQVSAYDGLPRSANNYSNEYGGNYHATAGRAGELVRAVWDLSGGETPSSGNDTPITPAVVITEDDDVYVNLAPHGQPGSDIVIPLVDSPKNLTLACDTAGQIRIAIRGADGNWRTGWPSKLQDMTVAIPYASRITTPLNSGDTVIHLSSKSGSPIGVLVK